MKRKKIRQAMFIVAFHIAGIAWLISGMLTATTLN